MTYEQFYALRLGPMAAMLDAYDCYLLGESANGGNREGLERMGKQWLHHRCINISGTFEAWLRYQNEADFNFTINC